ncbi:hypothetical protein PRIPAC_74695 [Pristionchus pacificus]|uniref:Uncharacterized protein n=1 Tax=Pristionchus pacificus TaxID=54126 RepID=A0A2A6CGE9_PRIPA|nr:hypothetical protein PRIPAC_74695 [Pristionchus pacificus]|eukprot:PDM77101.1 hypothetical protein PRIPAC_43013 [Pristionchus pacificus]
MATIPKVTVNQPPIPPQEDSGPTIPDPPKKKLAPGLQKLQRPYINTDEVLRLGSILERKMKLTAEHRASFDWLAFTRTQDMQQMPEFFMHLQRAVGGVLLQPLFAIEVIHYLFNRKLLTPAERDAISGKIREMNPSILTISYRIPLPKWPPEKIDKIASKPFLFFPTRFAMFNIIYWSYYTQRKMEQRMNLTAPIPPTGSAV